MKLWQKIFLSTLGSDGHHQGQSGEKDLLP